MTKKILIAGESWTSFTTHVKGFDTFTTSTYAEGVDGIRDAFESGGYEVTYIPNHLAPKKFPLSSDELGKYDAVVLSDIGSNTLLLSDNVFVRGSRESNRLNLLRDYVLGGGSLLMIGGYMSFTGIDAKTRYGETAVAEVLPVNMLEKDDRSERPEGIVPEILVNDHPIFAGIDTSWPHFLGYNRTTIRTNMGKLLAQIGGDPFIAIGEFGSGRSAVFTSDCAPHWGPKEFMDWEYYNRFWINLADWLCDASGK